MKIPRPQRWVAILNTLHYALKTMHDIFVQQFSEEH